MKQVLQDLGKGKTYLLDAPTPSVRPGHLLIQTRRSLISTGTERMLIDFGNAGLLAKARAQPEKVIQVLNKVRTDGLLTTLDAVRSKLAQPIPLGYCNVGTVVEVGAGVQGFAVGDRVVSNGPHADMVLVPQNLCAFLPDAVSDESAAFAVVASIGLQGIRLANPTLGEAFVVTGAGLIGLLTVQLLLAQGCRVLAIDFDDKKLALARQFGAETCNPALGEDPVAVGKAFSRGLGIDGVIITASTKSSDPVSQAAAMCRKRGRIILVGVTGLELNRSDFYEKELSFQVSCSYGPGRYDPAYEDQGNDYPVGFVRWTEQRNFQAVIDMIASGAVQTDLLVSSRVPFIEAPRAYDLLASDPKALGIILDHDHDGPTRQIASVRLGQDQFAPSDGTPAVSFVGAGNYAGRVLIPAFKNAGVTLRTIASAGGTSGVVQGKRMGFSNATSDPSTIWADDATDGVVIATRHDSHARLAIDALNAGKHVFVEKPLCLTREELSAIRHCHAISQKLLMVGFNRRFAPLVVKMKRLVDAVIEPKAIIMMMNAGEIPGNHWAHDPQSGGGRILGEACHHIDLMRFLVGHPITSMEVRRMGANPAQPIVEDKAVVTLGFADGSFGTVHYLANGGASFPKERIEVFAGGRTLQLDNFVALRGFNWPGLRTTRLLRQNKGQDECASAFANAIATTGNPPIPANELFEVAEWTIEAVERLRAQQ